jgi:hypothetical protein
VSPTQTHTLKKTSVVIVGRGKLYAAIVAILTHRKTPYIAGLDIHFVSGDIAVVDGFRVQADRFLILSPTTQASLFGTNRLPVSDSAINQAGNSLFIGDGQNSVVGALGRNSKVANTIVTHGEYILPTHDKAVQEVMANYLRKQKVDILLGHSAVATTKNTDGRYITVLEKAGRPTILKTDVVFEERLETSNSGYGFENINKTTPTASYEAGGHRISSRVTLFVEQNASYTLAQAKGRIYIGSTT